MTAEMMADIALSGLCDTASVCDTEVQGGGVQNLQMRSVAVATYLPTSCIASLI